MVSKPATDQPSPKLWQFVQPDDYRLPAAPVKLMGRNGFEGLRRFLGVPPAQSSSAVDNDRELQDPPTEALDRLAPSPDWSDAAATLNDALEPLLDGNTRKPSLIVLLCPPRSDHARILTTWAETRQWQIIEAPSAEQILNGNPDWPSGRAGQEGSWVLPHLEHWYLRHVRGLDSVRELIRMMDSGLAGQGVVGCDSWAWAFLKLLWKGRPPVLYCAQAFDAESLSACLRKMIPPLPGGPLEFRQSDDGREVLSAPYNGGGESSDTSPFMKELAAYSRGIPSIALSIWRTALRISIMEGQSADGPIADEDPAASKVFWLKPWKQMDLPVLPEGAGRDHAFALHALLLHNGLEESLVQKLLPLSTSRVAAILAQLESAGIVEKSKGAWRVTSRGYPAVRQLLSGEDYLTDQF
ncbi:MAG: hypothetical protein AB9873_08070 [Syntrophobacteraceae bacterium]